MFFYDFLFHCMHYEFFFRAKKKAIISKTHPEEFFFCFWVSYSLAVVAFVSSFFANTFNLISFCVLRREEEGVEERERERQLRDSFLVCFALLLCIRCKTSAVEISFMPSLLFPIFFGFSYFPLPLFSPEVLHSGFDSSAFLVSEWNYRQGERERVRIWCHGIIPDSIWRGNWRNKVISEKEEFFVTSHSNESFHECNHAANVFAFAFFPI